MEPPTVSDDIAVPPQPVGWMSRTSTDRALTWYDVTEGSADRTAASSWAFVTESVPPDGEISQISVRPLPDFHTPIVGVMVFVTPLSLTVIVAIPGRGYIVVVEKYPSRYGASAGVQPTDQPVGVDTQPAVAGAPESMCVGTHVGCGAAVSGGVIGDCGTDVGATCPAAAFGVAEVPGPALAGVDAVELDRGVDADTLDAFAVLVQPARTTTSTGRSANLAAVETVCRTRYSSRT
ncbi:hypothetical protein [Leifsonia sp. LS-T14]|uniref:hypothetical protein n=1 Tax=unclassified Leifsonia TaxID=2663824 RepID=UPI0035A5739F